MKWVMVVPLIVLAACASTDTPRPLSARDAKLLDKALAGKVAGLPVNCVSRDRLNNPLSAGDGTLLYRVGRKLTYRNDLGGQCFGLAGDGVPIFQPYGGQYCRGDILQVADRQTGMLRRSCVLGPFIPYRTPEK